MKRAAGERQRRRAQPGDPLAELAARWSLDATTVRKLRDLLVLVRDDPRAATSVRDPRAAVHVHLADSLSALPFLGLPEESSGTLAIDLGSGAGFPGLPLAIARPALEVHLLDSIRRKCEFIEHAARELALKNAAAVNGRAEDWARAGGRERYGLVLARAVAPLATLVEYAAPLLSAGGRLVAWKGARDSEEEAAGERAAEAVGLTAAGIERVEPYPGSRAHNLHLYVKSRPTPQRFPRRPGVARKQPLG